ncbi:aspartic peptidase domain-containing protein [Lyophyllum atratum]|nr:aspartic peptidase domain-containing protein [Lyophyllum atratum]
MRLLHCFSFGLVLSSQASLVASTKIPFTKRDARPKTLIGVSTHSKINPLADATDDNDALGNVGNIRYTTNITINGKEVHVALDTGSTDLWVIPLGGIGKFNDTGIPLSLLYGDGTYGVKGTIGVAPFEFGPYNIERQAFLNANESTIGAMTQIGIYGLFGLGFDHPEASPVNSAIERKYGPSATWGASVLQNIFNQNASKPNFIAVDLARTEDLESTAGGSFNIGEYDEEYAAVAAAPQLLQFPKNATRWTTLLEGIKVNGVPIKIASTIKGVPKGKALTLVDTGNPSGSFSGAIMEGIFSKIEGAVRDSSERVWIVPCTVTPTVELVLGGQSFPMHPLDLTEVSSVPIEGVNHTVCTNSFLIDNNPGQDEFELVFGDTFLRNVYAVYDFGDPSGMANGTANVPYMQFLTQVDSAKAAKEHVALRTKAIAENGPELPPKEILALLDDGASTTSGAPKPTGSVKAGVNLAPNDGSNPDIARYAPAVIGLLAANLLVGMVLLILGVVGCVRRGTPREGRAREMKAPHYVPVKFRDEDGGVAGYRDGEGTYDTPYSKHHS